MGCGQMAQSIHLPVLTHLPDVRLVALAETDPGCLKKASCFTPRALAFDHYEKLLQWEEMDAVVICLPNHLHAEAAMAALQRGKHVYLEKPLGINLKEGQKVLEGWKQAGTVGMIGFNYRFNPLYQTMRQEMISGKIGKLVYARSVFSTPLRSIPEWKSFRETGGGALLDLASHHIDLIRFIFNQEIVEVSTKIRSIRTEDDQAIMELCLADGLWVQSFFSISSVEEDGFEVYGQTGKFSVNRYLSPDVERNGPTLDLVRLKRLWRSLKALSHIPGRVDKIRLPGSEPSYRKALSCFVAAAKENRPATPDFYDGYRSLEIVVAAEKSAKTGRTISLPDTDR
jgi:predicted dehydrogenase